MKEIVNCVSSFDRSKTRTGTDSPQSYAGWTKTKWEERTKSVCTSVSVLLRSCFRYNVPGHKLRLFTLWEAQFVTVKGINP
jgi:hypothetical protein